MGMIITSFIKPKTKISLYVINCVQQFLPPQSWKNVQRRLHLLLALLFAVWADEFIFALTFPLLCDKGLHYPTEIKNTYEWRYTIQPSSMKQHYILFWFLTFSTDVPVQICLLNILETHQQWELEGWIKVSQQSTAQNNLGISGIVSKHFR